LPKTFKKIKMKKGKKSVLKTDQPLFICMTNSMRKFHD